MFFVLFCLFRQGYDQLCRLIRLSLSKLGSPLTDEAVAEEAVSNLVKALEMYLEQKEIAVYAGNVWELVKTVSDAFVEAGVHSPLWRNPALGYLSARVLRRQADEVGDSDVWESARILGKALALILDGAYISAVKDNIPVDQYFHGKPEITLLGRELHELCEKVSGVD